MSNRRAQDERIEGTPDGVNAITEIVDVPDAPTIGTATAGIGSASVPFTAATTGGTVSTFTATSTPGSITGTSATSPITVSGLTGGTAYTFTVTPSNSTGTGIASSSSNSVTIPDLVNGYDALGAVTLSESTASVTFSGIPNGYDHLQLRAFLKGTAASNRSLTFNGITSGYFQHRLEGSGTAASAGGYTSQSQIAMPITSAQWGTVIFDFLDYADVNKNKTVRMLGGYDNNGSGFIGLTSGSVANTDAITSITIAGDTWQIYSSFALYGVK